MVGPGRYDQPDVHASSRCKAQGPSEHLVGNKIRGHDPDTFPRCEYQGDERLVERVVGHVGAAGHDLDQSGPPWRRSVDWLRGLRLPSLHLAGLVSSTPVANAQSEKKSDSRSATAGPCTTTDRSSQLLGSGVGQM